MLKIIIVSIKLFLCPMCQINKELSKLVEINKMNLGVIRLVLDKDKEIIEEYVNGNREKAATAFVRKYQNFVFSTALRYLKSYDDADDAAQEVFIKALDSVHKFRGDSGLKTWLYRITQNVCTNISRKRRFTSIFKSDNEENDEYLNIPDTGQNPEQRFLSEEFEDKFMKVLNRLPEKQRETFALRYFDELPYEEISKLLGTSVGGLKANYFQAVKKLAGYLKDEKIVLN
jgi:RNA polymerase sigma-70 factor (ECF subfamily)